MPDTLCLWLRHETRPNEHRAALVPADARRLVEAGIRLTVEESTQRVFPVHEYASVGCQIAPQNSWPSRCPAQGYVLGLKELPDLPARLRHRHIFFGHAYKGQTGAEALLRRFEAGGGVLLDLESLVDADGRRLAAFGHWAGYAGASLAVLHRRGRLVAPLARLSRPELDERLRCSVAGESLTAVVIGAHGRSGRGACEALRTAGVEPSRWNSAETRCLDRDALLAHDILVNAIGTSVPVGPFLTEEDLYDPRRRLSVIGDVTCDVGSRLNALPIHDRATDWEHPVERLCRRPTALDVIALDNLPSLLPAEASRAFSAELWPFLLELREDSPVWERCLNAFRRAAGSLTDE